MVNLFFTLLRTQQHMLGGPLGPYIDEFAGLIHKQGYRREVVRQKIRCLADFSWWLQGHGFQVKDIDSKRISGYLKNRKYGCKSYMNESFTIGRFMILLRSKGLLPSEATHADKTESQLVVDTYERYLSVECGLAKATLINYLRVARDFLSELYGQKPCGFHQMNAREIVSYVRHHARGLPPNSAGMMVTGLRSFLRYLHHQGRITSDLAAAVPSVAFWQLSTLPNFLPIAQVQRVLEGCNRKTSVGRRDYAILMLLARLGLRANEVACLTLDDIRWHTGEIVIQGKGPRKSCLPLSQDVGQALANYLKKGRPPCSSRRFFIRNRAPYQEFVGANTVSALASRALTRAGVSSTRKGAHVFRHSLATHMLRQGAKLADIGDLLRHRNINTTAIYAKVDFEALFPLAQPWPRGIR